MDPKVKITVGLLAACVLAGTALALGVGRPPGGENPGVAVVRQEASYPGRKLFNEHQCVVCHGVDGSGTAMGPGLGGVMPLYIEAARGDRAAAREMLLRYLRDPQKVPVLRMDTTRYPNPMPSAQGLGLAEGDLGRIADFILDMKPASVAVGGDASGR